MKKEQVINKLKSSWKDLLESISGLSKAQMLQPGVTGEWSVKNILAHVTTWEEECLKHLPVILEGRRTERYSVQYGGIDSFNALMSEQKSSLSLDEVLDQLANTHQTLIEFVESQPDDLFLSETRFRKRLRLDTYSHYPIHTHAIRLWRSRAEI